MLKPLSASSTVPIWHRCFAGLVLFLLVLADIASAADIHWKGAGTGGNTAVDPANTTTQWSLPSNWLQVTVPGEADHAIFNFANAGAVHAADFHVEDLSLYGSAGALRLDGGVFTVDDFVSIQGNAKVVQSQGVHYVGRELNINGAAGTDAYRLEAGELHSGNAVPWWEGEVFVGRGGFTQTGGWHNVVEDMRIASSLTEGGYHLFDGDMTVDTYLYIHGTSTVEAGFRQTGGSVDVGDRIWMGAVNGTRGRYELLGGMLTTRRALLGNGGHAVFEHADGDFIVMDELVLSNFDQATANYSLSAGSLTVPTLIVTREGTSDIVQSGGVVNVTDRIIFSQNTSADAEYRLSGGELHVNEMFLGGEGTERFTQQGGIVDAGVLSITDNAVYKYEGGSLQIGGGFQVRGTIDFSSAPLTLDVGPDKIVELSGTILNSSQTSLHVGNDSLTILPAGFNPSTVFANYSNTGHVAIQGSGYSLPAGQTIRGAGDVNEFLTVNGTVEAVDGGQLHLHGVLVNSGGSVDLKTGQALINKNGSGVHGGTLRANRMTLSSNFSHTAGSVVLENDLNMSGQYTISGGSLSAQISRAYGTFHQQGGQVEIAQSLRFSSGGYTLQSGTLSTQETGMWDNAQFTQTGGIHTTDRVRTVSRGRYNISGGQLAVGIIGVGEDAGGTVEISGTAEVDVETDVRFGQGGRLTFSGGVLRTPKLGIGLSLGNSVVWTGGRLEVENISGGLLVNNGGVLAPTSFSSDTALGLLSINASYTQNIGTLEIELGGDLPGVLYDRVEITGAATLSGALDVSFLNDFQPSPGDRFDILTAASITGVFDSLILPTLAGGREWLVEYQPQAISLIVSGAADFNGDGVVDSADLSVWQQSHGSNSGADADGDGDSDGRDLLRWQREFSTGAPNSTLTAVPEPATALLASLVAMVVVVSRRVRSENLRLIEFNRKPPVVS